MVLYTPTDQEVTSIRMLGPNFTDLDSQDILTPPSEQEPGFRSFVPNGLDFEAWTHSVPCRGLCN